MVVLPEPDSPTRPSTSPAATSKETWSTTTLPPSVTTVRSFTCRLGTGDSSVTGSVTA